MGKGVWGGRRIYASLRILAFGGWLKKNRHDLVLFNFSFRIIPKNVVVQSFLLVPSLIVLSKTANAARRHLGVRGIHTRVRRNALLVDLHARRADANLQPGDVRNRVRLARPQLDAPVQVAAEVRHHVGGLEARKLARRDVLQQRRGERHRTSDDELVVAVVAASRAGGVGAAAQHGHAPHRVVLGVTGPVERVRAEIAEEDDDAEGLREAVLLGADVDDPVGVVVVRDEAGEGIRDGSWRRLVFNH